MSSIPRSGRVVAWITAAALLPSAALPVERPNVLLVVADDLNTCLRCYGHPVVHSPHLDRLAAAGVRFERAYTQSPLCNPARVALLTGRYPSSDGVSGNRQHFRDHSPDVVTLPEYFRSHGYVTARVGKVFHNRLDDARSWTEGGRRGKSRPPRPADTLHTYNANSDRWGAVPGDGAALKDYATASRAIELLERPRDQPFFIAVGLSSTHTPLVAPERDFALHPADAVTLPPDFAETVTPVSGIPSAMFGPNGDLFVGRAAPEPLAREATAAYFAAISFLDSQLGRILDALDRLDLADNTVVVFTSDHGFHLGEKGRWSKHRSFFEPVLRVPLIVAAPGDGRVRAGVSQRVVELVDLYATLVALAELPRPAGLEGQSLETLLANPAAAWGHEAYSAMQTTVGFATSVRDARYRYTEWDRGRAGAFLTDFASDPHESVNRVDDPALAGVVEHLRQRVRTTLR